MSAAATTSASGPASDAPSIPSKAECRLPTTVRPLHYRLTLRPELAAATFQGRVEVDIEIKEQTDKIVVNAAELQVQSAEVVIGDRVVSSSSVSLNEADEVLTLTFPSALPVGSAVLRCVYTGTLNDQMRGFYLSTYKDEADKEHRIATTQFEATDCRRALPSWDEPEIKAVFTVVLEAPSELRALSNMPAVTSTPLSGADAGLTRHEFAPTPLMSTYLLAFIVGAFDCLEATTSEGTLVRCFAPPGKGEQTRFSLDFACKLLPFYNKWFETPYPLPKLDMIAIPDFNAGAMENWGLITYREAALLLDPSNSSAQTKQWVAVCVAHEIAHQWFGNLVTMSWWTDLWLNEGFATWMENYAVDHFYPEWKMFEQFVYSDLNTSFELDSLVNSHPIEVTINHASETDEIFDTISYSKGCVVIRQLEAFLGAEVFRAGLIRYIAQYTLKNAETADLWRVLSETSGKDVQAMMQAWTKETGFPILQIEEDDSAPEGTLQFKATQTRFLQTGPDASSKVTWPVPVTFLVAGQKTEGAIGKQVFAERQGVLRVDAKEAGLAVGSAPKWIKLNAAQAGMYRVHYTPKLFSALCAAVAARDPLLSASDRLGVQNDAFALARCGLLSTVQLLELVQSYSAETDPAVWSDLLANLSDIALLVQEDAETYERFQRYVHRLLERILAQVGWEKQPDEPHVTSMLRAKVIGACGRYNHPEVVQSGLTRFAAFLGSGQAAAASAEGGGQKASGAASLSPDLRGSVYNMAVANGGLFGYESLLYLRSRVTLSEEQVRCLQALAASRDPVLLRRTLDLALSPAVRAQDGPSLIAAVAANRFGSALCWEWTKSQWPALLKKFNQSSSLSRIVGQCGNFSTAAAKEDVEAFFAQHAHPGAERAVKQAVERIDSNAKWRSRDLEQAKEWIKANDEKHKA